MLDHEHQSHKSDAGAADDYHPILSVRLGAEGRRDAERLAGQADKANASTLVRSILIRIAALVGHNHFDVRKLTYDPDLKIEDNGGE